MPEPALPKINRNDDIECLRAIAVISVIFHHLQGNLLYAPTLVSLFKRAGFWSGVDLFFAISGFVITCSLLPQLGIKDRCWTDKRSLICAFWIRRCWRLLPSAWLWLGLIMLAVLTFNHSGAFGTAHANLMATLAGIANVANFRFADAFFRYEYGASFVYWSLSLEEQFYLLLPLLMAVLQRRMAFPMMALFLIQAAIIRTPLLMSLRTDALALGVLLALSVSSKSWERLNPRFLHSIGAWRMLFPGLLLTTLIVLSSNDLQAWRFHISLIALAAIMLVWIASYNEDYVLRKGHLKRMLVWIGARSYALYLIHVPVYFFLREICFRQGMANMTGTWLSMITLAASAILLMGLLADLNYRYVERPLRNYGKHLSDRYLAGRRARLAQFGSTDLLGVDSSTTASLPHCDR